LSNTISSIAEIQKGINSSFPFDPFAVGSNVSLTRLLYRNVSYL
jgi:hypothetical protein